MRQSRARCPFRTMSASALFPSHPLPATVNTLPILPGASQSEESPTIDNGTRRSRSNASSPSPLPSPTSQSCSCTECKSAIRSAAPLSHSGQYAKCFLCAASSQPSRVPCIFSSPVYTLFFSGRIPGIAGHGCDPRGTPAARERNCIRKANERKERRYRTMARIAGAGIRPAAQQRRLMPISHTSSEHLRKERAIKFDQVTNCAGSKSAFVVDF